MDYSILFIKILLKNFTSNQKMFERTLIKITIIIIMLAANCNFKTKVHCGGFKISLVKPNKQTKRMNVQCILNKGFSSRLKRETLRAQIKNNNISQHLLHSPACGSLMKYMMPRLCNCRYFISQSFPLLFSFHILYCWDRTRSCKRKVTPRWKSALSFAPFIYCLAWH